jgi:hypothetical protein
MLALVTSSAVTAGVAGPLAVQALDGQPGRAAMASQRSVPTPSQVGSKVGNVGGDGAGPATSLLPTLPILTVSLVPSPSDASYLDGALVWGKVHLAVRPPRGTTEVRFWLDGTPTGSPDRVDDSAPFTLVPDGEWLDAETLSEGPHVLRVLANAPGRGEVSVSATFAVRHAAGE